MGGRKRGKFSRISFTAGLFNSPDQIEELNALIGWINGVMSRLDIAKSPAFSVVLLDLIRFRMGKQSPDVSESPGLAEVDYSSVYANMKAEIMGDVRELIFSLINNGEKFQIIADARARIMESAEDDDLEPITDSIIENILADFDD